MMAYLIPILGLIFSVLALGAADPYAIESKVQQDLENALSRLIPREQFIIQATADVKVDTERRLVEGENIANAVPIDPEDIPPPAMPGFVPEPSTKAPMLPHQSRQVYKTVEVPTLRQLRVHTTFDDQLPLATVTQGRLIVTNYLNSNYSGKTAMTFGQMPMIKGDKREDDLLKKLTDWEKKKEKPAPSLEEQAWKYGRWSALVLLMLIIVTQFLKPQISRMQATYQTMTGKGREPEAPRQPRPVAYTPPPVAVIPRTPEQEATRKQLLDRFLIRSEVFSSYYDRLNDNQRSDLYGALSGPGYDRLLTGLNQRIPTGARAPSNAEELIAFHAKQFDELVRATDWQDRQFFGFLNQLRNEQVLTLAQHLNPRGLAMMLRFMKPHQSANVLDSLPTARRLEVLSAMQNTFEAPLSDVHMIENEVREILQQLPSQQFNGNANISRFWGDLISESANQEELLAAIEKTNPEIFASVKKFKFALEDILKLPNSTIESVISNVDNTELGQALATCREDVVDTILEVMSPKRRQVIVSQIASYRRVPREALSSARSSLTKKFREAIA